MSLMLSQTAVPHPIHVVLEKGIVILTLIVKVTWFVETLIPVLQEHLVHLIVVFNLQQQPHHHLHLVTPILIGAAVPVPIHAG